MKLPLVGLLACLLFVGCGKSEKEQLEDELISVVGTADNDKIREAEFIFHQCDQPEEKNDFRQTGFMKAEGIQKAHLAHQVTTHFLDYSNKIRQQYDYQKSYPLDEMNKHFQISFDSLAQLAQTPDKNYAAFDYTQSKHKSNLVLTTIRMEYDIATLEVDVLNDLLQAYWVTVIRDDFRQHSQNDK
jgi:hypothetical protein